MEQASHDTTLFDRIQSDDRTALNELFMRYYPRLCQFAATYISMPEAEEVVSDVFFVIWKQRNEIIVRKSLRAYLYAAVRHACLAIVRKDTPGFQSLDEVQHTAAFTHHIDPHQTLHVNELHTFIETAIGQLPQRCREIFIMNRYDGLKYREIAEILSLSEKTVENQVIKALQIMRAHLGRYENSMEYPA